MKTVFWMRGSWVTSDRAVLCPGMLRSPDPGARCTTEVLLIVKSSPGVVCPCSFLFLGVQSRKVLKTRMSARIYSTLHYIRYLGGGRYGFEENKKIWLQSPSLI